MMALTMGAVKISRQIHVLVMALVNVTSSRFCCEILDITLLFVRTCAYHFITTFVSLTLSSFQKVLNF